MSFTLDYKENREGFLTAWGTGLKYEYDTHDTMLRISRREKQKPLARFNFDGHLSDDPLSYITALEKACQIKALMFSNNQTVDISKTLESERLKAILKSAARLSRYAYDLQTSKYERFCDAFARDFDLKAIKLKKFVSGNRANEFYVARIQTPHDNKICVRACTLAGITSALSEKTARDLITQEFGHRFEQSAYNLVQVSSRLSALSCILDEHFIPSRKIVIRDAEENTNTSRHPQH